jgi:RNA polymerase sigma-70 factor (ECF subfamily)
MLLGDEAEAWDMVHDTFIKLLTSKGRFRSNSDPVAFIYRVTTNVCLNYLGAKKVRQAFVHERARADEEGFAPGVVEARDLIYKLIGLLDDESLQIATLSFLDGLSQDEISNVVGLSRKTVGRKLRRVEDLASRLRDIPKEVGDERPRV